MTGCSEKRLMMAWDVHSHVLSVTIGLATQLVQTWGSTVYRDVLALLQYHGCSSHVDDT